MAEETSMQQSKEVSVNWLRVNVPSVVSIVIVGISVALYIGKIDSRVGAMETNRTVRNLSVDKSFDQITDKLDKLNTIPYRVDALERNLVATNTRMDTYLQTLGSKLDGIGDRVNTLSTKVEVLSQKIEAITPENKETSYKPIYR